MLEFVVGSCGTERSRKRQWEALGREMEMDDDSLLRGCMKEGI